MYLIVSILIFLNVVGGHPMGLVKKIACSIDCSTLAIANNLMPNNGNHTLVIETARELVDSGSVIFKVKSLLKTIAELNIVVEALESPEDSISSCAPEVLDSYAKAFDKFDRASCSAKFVEGHEFRPLNSMMVRLGERLIQRCRYALIVKMKEIRSTKSQKEEDQRMQDAISHLSSFSRFLKPPEVMSPPFLPIQLFRPNRRADLYSALNDDIINEDQKLSDTDKVWLESLDAKRSNAIEEPVSSKPKKEKSTKDLIAATCGEIDKNAETKKFFETGIKWALLCIEFFKKTGRHNLHDLNIGNYRICKYLQGKEYLQRQEVDV